MNDAILVGGEEFTVTRDDGYIIISHPIWSLVGVGKTHAEAITDFLSDMHDQYTIMVDDDPNDLSDHAIALRRFLLRFFEE